MLLYEQHELFSLKILWYGPRKKTKKKKTGQVITAHRQKQGKESCRSRSLASRFLIGLRPVKYGGADDLLREVDISHRSVMAFSCYYDESLTMIESKSLFLFSIRLKSLLVNDRGPNTLTEKWIETSIA